MLVLPREYPKALLDQSQPQSRSLATAQGAGGNFREGNSHLSTTFQPKTHVCLLEEEHAGSSKQDVPCPPSCGTAELCSPPSEATAEISKLKQM